MNWTEQRISIAEACGWIKAYEEGADEGCGKWFWHCGNQNLKQPPDYPNDLNAMHEAWATLPPFHQVQFAVELSKTVERDYLGEWATLHDGAKLSQIVNATAPQRAEAFLRTIGKWKD